MEILAFADNRKERRLLSVFGLSDRLRGGVDLRGDFLLDHGRTVAEQRDPVWAVAADLRHWCAGYLWDEAGQKASGTFISFVCRHHRSGRVYHWICRN